MMAQSIKPISRFQTDFNCINILRQDFLSVKTICVSYLFFFTIWEMCAKDLSVRFKTNLKMALAVKPMSRLQKWVFAKQ